MLATAYEIMKILESGYFWCFCFTLIFCLGLDFWNWSEKSDVLGWFNFPGWVFYFIGLQMLLSAALLVFASKVWTNTTEDEENH